LVTFIPSRQHLFRLDDPSISYPVLPDIVDYPLLIVLVFVIPMLIIACISVFVVRSLHDLHHAALGLFQSLAVALLLVSIIKIYLGGLRPHFLERCAPDPAKIPTAPRYGYNGLYYDTSICTGDPLDVNDAQSAFPSGHSALSAAGMTFLSLYLNAKFKMFQNRGHLWIYILVTISCFGSFLVGFSRIVDFHHTPYNVVMGMIIGFVIALSMFRLNYLSVFGKYNHVPVADHWYSRTLTSQPEPKQRTDDVDNAASFNYSIIHNDGGSQPNITYGTQTRVIVP